MSLGFYPSWRRSFSTLLWYCPSLCCYNLFSIYVAIIAFWTRLENPISSIRKPQKQPQRIPPINRAPHPLIHLIPFKLSIIPFRLNRRIRKITPIQHPLRQRPLEQRVQYIRTGTQRRIEAKALRILQNLLSM